MNIKKIICYGLIFGSVFSLTSCSIIDKNNISINNEKNNLDEYKKEELNKKVVDSIITQINNQISNQVDAENENKNQRNIEIEIKNETKYTYLYRFINFDIKDNNGEKLNAQLTFNASLLKPGQKCYANLHILSDYDGISEIKYNGEYSGRLFKAKEYDILKADVSNVEFFSLSSYVKFVAKNNYSKDYNNAQFYIEYVDEDGYVYNNIALGNDLTEFISGESYPINISIINRGINIYTDNKDNIEYKLLIEKE